jgi:hypothetical protein
LFHRNNNGNDQLPKARQQYFVIRAAIIGRYGKRIREETNR